MKHFQLYLRIVQTIDHTKYKLEELSVIYNICLRGYLHAKQGNQMEMLFQQMKDKGIPRDSYTYTYMLEICQKKTLKKAMEDYLHKMKEDGISLGIFDF
jgi:pentatricopeptide repeat protein